METVILAVRHGETEWNLVGRMQGHSDSPLTATGVRQARLLAEGLAGKRVDILYSSDLGRALRTAEIIAGRLSLDIQVDPRLRERQLGVMEGLTRQEFAARFPQDAAQFNSGDPDYAVPGGESARQRHGRCVACAEDLARRHAGKRLLLVGHGGTLCSFFYKATNTALTEPRRFSVLNASVSSFRVDGGQWLLDTWGETAHLDALRALDDN